MRRCACRQERDSLMNKQGASLSICLALSIMLFLNGCHRDTDRDKVVKIVHRVQKAAEEKDIREILSFLSRTYRDPQGNDYAGIKDLLLVYFYRYPKVSVYVTGLEVSAEGTAAGAKFQAMLTGSGTGGASRSLLPEALGVYGFDVRFVSEKGDWKIVSAQWERLGDATADPTRR